MFWGEGPKSCSLPRMHAHGSKRDVIKTEEAATTPDVYATHFTRQYMFNVRTFPSFSSCTFTSLRQPYLYREENRTNSISLTPKNTNKNVFTTTTKIIFNSLNIFQ